MEKIIQNFKNYIYNRQIEVLELQISNEDLEINVHRKHLKEKEEKVIQKELDKVKAYLLPFEIKTLTQDEMYKVFIEDKVKVLMKQFQLKEYGIHYKKNRSLKKYPNRINEIEEKANLKLEKLNKDLERKLTLIKNKHQE